MRNTFVAILIVLSFCSGCVTRSTKDEAGNTVGKSRTVWIWQKDFWGNN
jgi:hypothetical protein